MQQIIDMFSNFSIKHKLWGGFAIVLTILGVVVALTLVSLRDTQEKVVLMTKEIQPTLIASSTLMEDLTEASRALGFYLLTKEKIHKDTYHNHLERIDQDLIDLKDTPVVRKSEEAQARIAAIETKVQAFKAYQKRMNELAEDRTKNFLPLGLANDKLNPVSNEIQQIITDMLLSESNESFTPSRKALHLALQDLRYTWSNVNNNVRIFLLFGSPDVLGNINLFVDGAQALIKKASGFKSQLTFEEEEGLHSLAPLLETYKTHIKELASIYRGERAQTDAYLIRSEIGPLLADVSNSLKELVNEQQAAIETNGTALIDQATATVTMVATLLLLGLVMGGGVAWLITLAVVGPLSDANRAMDNIAEGEGDLTQRLKRSGNDEISHLAGGFNVFTAKIQELLQKISDSTVQISNASLDMAEATQKTSATIREQRTETDQVATAIHELSAVAQDVAQNAELAAGAARKADHETTAGRKIVGQALEAINNLADQTQESAEAIQKLGTEIQSVGSVIDVIRGITEQTNLLALNAAIEAARAGEQGRGFAVVADEVRTLATRTQQSTTDIQKKIEHLQQDAERAVASMMRNRELAKESMHLAATAGESLTAITQAVSNISEMTTHIASAAEEQSATTAEVSQNVANITTLADQADHSAQHVSLASVGLKQLSESLSFLVGRFKI